MTRNMLQRKVSKVKNRLSLFHTMRSQSSLKEFGCFCPFLVCVAADAGPNLELNHYSVNLKIHVISTYSIASGGVAVGQINTLVRTSPLNGRAAQKAPFLVGVTSDALEDLQFGAICINSIGDIQAEISSDSELPTRSVNPSVRVDVAIARLDRHLPIVLERSCANAVGAYEDEINFVSPPLCNDEITDHERSE